MVSGGIDIGTTSGWVRWLQATFALIFRLAVLHQQFEGFEVVDGYGWLEGEGMRI
jgi:hypothetical protein